MSENEVTKQKCSLNWKQLIVSVVVLFLAVATAYYCNDAFKIEITSRKHQSKMSPKYCVYASYNSTYVLTSVELVLQRLGLEKEALFSHGDKLNENCNIIWTYDDPFDLHFNFKQLEYHQRLNHIPGNYALASKSFLATTTNSKYIPKAFTNSDDLKKYAKQHPEKKFVQKMKSNRGVELKKASEMKFVETKVYNSFFAQEFIENPLLFEGHKFDIGVYAVITSVHPLRVYYFKDNVGLRFCKLPYDENNFDEIGSYVVNDDHITAGDFPEIDRYYNKSYNFKATLNTYFTDKGYNMSKVWTQVEDSIQTIMLSREKYYIKDLKEYKSKYSFFELYRFDMMLDNKLNLYVMECNQSPNVYASKKVTKNKQLYESVLYNTLNLVGVGSPIQRTSFKLMEPEVESMAYHLNSFSVMPVICMNSPCNISCIDSKCNLCNNCLKLNQKYDLRMAYQEQLNIGVMKRIFPATNHKLTSLSIENQLHSKWFIEMCKNNDKFC